MLLDANGVVLFANKEAQERLAPKNDSLEGASLASVLTPEHPLLALVQSTVAGTEAHDVPLTLPAGGTYLVSFLRLGRERVPAGLLIVLRDLAPVMELETALDSSNRLARLGTLISGLAHQLRSPLNGMNMRLELLRHEAGDKGAKHIDKLRHEVTRLDESIEALLRFMRPEQLKLSVFDMNELLKELGGRVNSERCCVLASSFVLLSNARKASASARGRSVDHVAGLGAVEDHGRDRSPVLHPDGTVVVGHRMCRLRRGVRPGGDGWGDELGGPGGGVPAGASVVLADARLVAGLVKSLVGAGLV